MGTLGQLATTPPEPQAEQERALASDARNLRGAP